AIGGCVRTRRLDPRFLMVVTGDRIPAYLRRRDGQYPGAGAKIGQRAGCLARLPQPEQIFQAEAGGRVGAGAESAAGVDHYVDRPLARRLPGGAQPEAVADQERLVEVLPAVGPIVGNPGRDQLDEAVAG